MSPDTPSGTHESDPHAHRARCAKHALLLGDDGRCLRCDGDVVRGERRRAALLAFGALALVTIVGVGGALAYRIGKAMDEVRAAEAAPRPPPSGKVKIVVFGANWCGSCRAAKAWLKGEGYAFEWHDVDDAATGRLLQTEAKIQPGRISIPVIGVDGQYASGFSARGLERRIREAEARRAAEAPPASTEGT